MGFDNECVLNIQSLPGEYFCPVCRTLIYPNEALQSQCTHLYCKPCLAYVVATTRACPYDGYLVTEADSKPLIESNKSLAETIGKVAVHCLYHKSGCQWQGPLSDCITHCAECSFGNSPVLCNRCGAQIMHRQVQEHGQTCLGMQRQALQVESQAQASTVQSQSSAASAAPASAAATAAVAAAPSTAAVAAPASVPATTAPAFGQGQNQGNVAAYPQTVAQAPTPEQWYQQQQLQYQQYYQQYPGYDPYQQQQYQQYVQYQQQPHPQYPQPLVQVAPQQANQGQQPPSQYMAPPSHFEAQPQTQTLAQPLSQPQPQPQASQLQSQQLQSQPQPQSHLHPQPQPQSQQLHSQPLPQPHAQQTQMQAQQLHLPAQQPHPQAQPQTHPPPHAQLTGQQLMQAQPHHSQSQPQQQIQPPQLQAVPQHQQSVPSQQHLHPQIQHLQPHPQQQPPQQHQPQPYPNPPPQPQVQQHHMQPQPQSIPRQQPQHPLVHAVTGHQSYPQTQLIQQIPHNAPQPRPMHTHPQQQGMPHQHPQHPVPTQNQFPTQQAPQMYPAHDQLPVQLAPQGPHTQQQAHHLVHQQGQQIHQHPGMQPPQQQHGSFQQQPHVHLPPGQPQQGTLPTQHPMHPLHSVLPQGSPHMQQHVAAQPPSQQNATSVQGLPAHQSQTTAVRPVMPNHSTLQQPSNQNYPVRGAHLMMTSEQQTEPMQHPQLTHSGSQSSSIPASPLPRSGIVAHQIPCARVTSDSASLDKVRDSISGKVDCVPGLEAGIVPKNAEGIEASNLANEQVEGTDSAELKSRKHDSDSGVEGETIAEVKERDIQPKGNGILESAQVHGKDLEAHAKAENVEEPELKSVKKEDDTESADEGTKSSNFLRVVEGDIGIQSPQIEPDGKSGAPVKGGNLHLSDGTGNVLSLQDSNNVLKRDSSASHDKTNQIIAFQGQIVGSVSRNMLAPPQHLLASASLDQGKNQQPHQHALQAHGRNFPQPGHHEGNLSQFPQLGSGSHDPRHMAPTGLVPVREIIFREPPHQMPDPTIISHRPPAPDRMFPQNPPHHGPSQERIFQQPPHQIQMHGQTLAHNQNFQAPHQRQTSVVPDPGLLSMGKQPYGSYHSEVPHSGLEGSARAPAPNGLIHRSFDEQGMAQGQNQNHMPPSHAVGARIFQSGPMERQGTTGPLGPPGPPPGQSGMMSMGPPFGPDDQRGWTHPDIKQANFVDGRQHEPHNSVPVEHVPFRQPHIQSNTMVMNGIPGKGPVGRMPDPHFSLGLTEERFKLLPEERFKQLVFEEDLKQFPRPAHLDGEIVPRFDGYMSSLRPMERGSQPFSHDVVSRSLDRVPRGSDGGAVPPTSWPLPTYPSNGPFLPISVGSAPNPADIGERQWPVGDLERKHNPTATHSDLLRPVHEFGHHRKDNVLPLRSPGREHTGLQSNRFGSGSQSRNEILPHLRAGKPLGYGLSTNIRGSEFGYQDLPTHLRFGESLVQVSLHCGMESLEHLRMRKPGSMGRCRICKIDCDTVEGLDQHSQTREHQKMAMDMVLSIKRDSAKRKKLKS